MCDWEDHATAVLFAAGCNMRCPTCHNGALIDPECKIPPVDRDEVLAFLGKRRKWLDGVVVTGGEPTTVPGLDLVIEDIRAMGFPVCLHTNGHRPEVVHELLERDLVELFAVDVKGPWEMYPELTGHRFTEDESRESMLEIFRMAEANPERFFLRTTLVPRLKPEHIEQMRKVIPLNVRWKDNQKYREPETAKTAA